MKSFSSKLFNIPWYPIILSAYPVLGLLSTNVGQVQSAAGVRPLLISLAFGGLLFSLVWLLFRQVHKAAFFTALLLVLFFTYGHAYIAIDDQYPDAGYTKWLGAAWLVLFLLSVFWVTRPKLTFVGSAATLNTIALALVAMAGWQVISQIQPQNGHYLAIPDAPIQTNLVAPQNPPDVYFFLLDSYGRADLLRRAY